MKKKKNLPGLPGVDPPQPVVDLKTVDPPLEPGRLAAAGAAMLPSATILIYGEMLWRQPFGPQVLTVTSTAC